MRQLLRLALLTILCGPFLAGTLAYSDDWPQWRGPNRDGVWKETGLPEKFPAGGLPIRWRAPAGNGFASPVVAQGRVYLIDAELTRPQAQERIRCFDEQTGNQIWQHIDRVTYPERAYAANNLGGPNATPIVQNGKLYTLGRRGLLRCFDAATGKILWERNLEKDFSTKEFSGTPSPLIEGRHLILDIGGKPDASLAAFDIDTGADVWKALDELQMCSSPTLVEAGGRRQVVVWTQSSVSSVDPANGKLLWRERFLTGGLTGISSPTYLGKRLIVAGLMLELDSDKPGARVLWPKTRAVDRRILSNTSTAALQGDHVYSARSSGQLVCIDAQTGEQIWETDKVTAPGRGSSIHITLNGSTALLFNDRGELIRAKISPEGYAELSRTQLIKASYVFEGRKVVWAYPAYANGCIFARNTEEMICASLKP